MPEMPHDRRPQLLERRVAAGSVGAPQTAQQRASTRLRASRGSSTSSCPDAATKRFGVPDAHSESRHRISRSNTQPRTSPTTPARSSGSPCIPNPKAVRTPPRGLGLADAARLEGLSCAGSVQKAAVHANASHGPALDGATHVTTDICVSSASFEREGHASIGAQALCGAGMTDAHVMEHSRRESRFVQCASLQALRIGEALYVGEADCNDRPNGCGTLLLPDGGAHRGCFEAGRAQGPGEYTSSAGVVCVGHWKANKRTGVFEILDADGKSWSETYDVDGKRIVREPLNREAKVAAVSCRLCKGLFHDSHNHEQACRRHIGSWSEHETVGKWDCCGSRKSSDRGCDIGEHCACESSA